MDNLLGIVENYIFIYNILIYDLNVCCDFTVYSVVVNDTLSVIAMSAKLTREMSS